MSVTVCITTHNDAHVLQRAFVSALEQTVSPLEVIIVDDGSDNEVVIPAEPDNYPHIACRVVRVTNRGLPAARNTALMLANGIGFLPLDADDWLDPHYIEKTLPLLRAGADVVLGGHDHDYERFAPQTASGKLDTAHGIREFVVGTGGKSHDFFSWIFFLRRAVHTSCCPGLAYNFRGALFTCVRL